MRLVDIVAQYLADLATRARPRGVEESRSILERVVRELDVDNLGQLTRPKVMAWRQQRLAAGSSHKTVNNLLAVLLAALSLCVRLEQIPANPLHGLRSLPVGARHQRRRPRALSEWEIARLLAAAGEIDRETADYQAARRTIDQGSKGRSYAERVRAPRIQQAILVRTLIETGARWGELTLATWGDLDEPAATLTFRAENTKTERERTVPLRADLLEDLRSYRLILAEVAGNMPAAHHPIFLSPEGKPMTRGTSNFRRFLGLAYERAGLLRRDERGRLRSADGRALNVHTLRHTCCTRFARAGAPLPVAQAMLGHASPAMTAKVYTHVVAEDARRVIESFGRTPDSNRPTEDRAVERSQPSHFRGGT
jgi:integrase